MTSRFYGRVLYWNLLVILVISLFLGSSPARVLIAITGGCVATFLIARSIRTRAERPLRELSTSIQKLASGDLTQRLPISGDEEIAAFGTALNSMAGSLGSVIKELTEGRQKMESIVSAMGEGVMVLDGDGQVALINRSLLDMIGTDRDLTGKTPLDIFRHPELEKSVRDALLGGPPRRVEVSMGSGRILEAHVAPVPNLSGVVDSTVVVFHDLTSIRRLERMRSDFVANVSHEFKTPLTSIRGYAETLLGGALEDPKNAVEFLRVIERNARHLETLVSDLLTLARLEAEIPASTGTVNIKTLVEEQISSRKSAIAGRGIKVETEGLDVDLQVDRSRLVTAVSNLIDNAIHYNRPSGEIRITGAVEDGWFILGVADTGEGIPNEELVRIFERFYRVDKARSRESGGTGLGLSIVKHAIESQGGSITVTSKVGSGSQFNIHLPMRLPPAA